MSYPQVTYSFENGPTHTIEASEINQNNDDIINGLSDGTKDIFVNNVVTDGDNAISGYSKVGTESAFKYIDLSATLTATDISNGYASITASYTITKVMGMHCTIYHVSDEIAYCQTLNSYFKFNGSTITVYFSGFDAGDQVRILMVVVE